MSIILSIRAALQTRGTAAEIARRSGVSAMTLSRIARGEVRNPGFETVSRIEAALLELESERARRTKTKCRQNAGVTKKSRTRKAA